MSDYEEQPKPRDMDELNRSKLAPEPAVEVGAKKGAPQKPAPTPSEDQPLTEPTRARIINVQPEDGQVRLLLGLGTGHGVRIGMIAAMTQADGRTVSAEIDRCDNMACQAKFFISHDVFIEARKAGTTHATITPKAK